MEAKKCDKYFFKYKTLTLPIGREILIQKKELLV